MIESIICSSSVYDTAHSGSGLGGGLEVERVLCDMQDYGERG